MVAYYSMKSTIRALFDQLTTKDFLMPLPINTHTCFTAHHLESGEGYMHVAGAISKQLENNCDVVPNLGNLKIGLN